MENKSPKTDSEGLVKSISIGDGTVRNLVLEGPPVKTHFNAWNIVAFAFVICNSWAGVAGSIQLALLQGGPATLIYSIIVSSIAYLSIAISLGELASAYPTAGGQYHFASILAPKKWKKGISYTCGLVAMFSWIAIGASITIIPAQQIMALVAVYNPSFQSKEWHIFLIYEAIATFVLLNNLFILKKAPWSHNIGFILSICLFLVGFIGLLARSPTKEPSKFVWTNFINYTGWPDGVCFMIGLSTSCFMYNGLDGATHIAEECENPKRAVPIAMISAVGIGFATAFAYTIAQLYALTDIEAIMTTTEYIPLFVLRQGLRSTTMATIFIAIAMVMAIFILNAVQETSSRLAWSFARDNGLVFSSTLSQIHPKLQVPVWSLLLTYGLLVVSGCVYVASTTAFNALIGSSIVLQEISFLIPVALLLLRKRSPKYLPLNRHFAMPSIVGWAANIIVVGFTVVTGIFFNFPIFLPTTANSMNYTCVILGIALILGLVNWFIHARMHYNGPSVRIENSDEQE